jgi:hypothetical protein
VARAESQLHDLGLTVATGQVQVQPGRLRGRLADRLEAQVEEHVAAGVPIQTQVRLHTVRMVDRHRCVQRFGPENSEPVGIARTPDLFFSLT